MKVPRQLAVWAAAAVVSLITLGVVMQRQHGDVQQRLAVQVATKPSTGGVIFREKGCASCHGWSAQGTKFGPSLSNSESLSTLPRLVTSMWNHAPRMWQAMEARQLPYPALSYGDMSQLVTYLYTSAYMDGEGDIKRGEHLFVERSCSACHTAETAEGKPSLVAISNAEDPLSWTQALWNHAPAMQERIHSTGKTWPKFEASDMRDLFAYVRHTHARHDDPPEISGDPERGWEAFQQKGCVRCHAISSASTPLGPAFGAERQLPPRFADFGAALLNHFPEMEKAIRLDNAQIPRFENHDVADIAVFLYSLHYLEPTGSPQVGKSVFAWRGCSRCHGDNAQGTASGPALRGRGHAYTAVRLATSLWAHGGRMYRSVQDHGQSWPALQDSDIGHLLTYLNTSPEP